jgi:hypothetical protein
MKNKLFVLSFFVFSAIGFTQSTMSVGKDFWSGSAIYLNGKKISLNEAKEIAKSNEEIVKKLSSAQTNRTLGGIISYPGSFAFGYTLGTSLGGNNIKPNWTVGGIGALMMIVGAIMQGKGNKQLNEAINDYNASIVKPTSSFNPEFYFATSENGLGLTMRF